MPGKSIYIHFDRALRADLVHRLEETRWSDAVTNDWQYGMNASFLKSLTEYWLNSYDFDAAEQRLNAIPHFRVEVEGFGISFLYLKGRGPRPAPLLLMNGWPSSFVEYGKLAPRLADPAAFGGSAEDAFDVIIPALPGFGFSDRPTRPYQVVVEDIFHALMTKHLGYASYITSGTDIGAGIATRLGLKYPGAVRGIHVSALVNPPTIAEPLSDAEKGYLARSAQWEQEEGAYQHLQCTRPQTLAFALADSPVGLASWIVEKFYAWSEHGDDLLQTFPADMLIDNLMIYWATGTLGSSMRYYYDSRHFRTPLSEHDHVEIPTAVCMSPRDLVVAPAEWAHRFYNVHQYTMQKNGGHFPAWEATESYAEDLRSFARLLDCQM